MAGGCARAQKFIVFYEIYYCLYNRNGRRFFLQNSSYTNSAQMLFVRIVQVPVNLPRFLFVNLRNDFPQGFSFEFYLSRTSKLGNQIINGTLSRDLDYVWYTPLHRSGHEPWDSLCVLELVKTNHYLKMGRVFRIYCHCP